MVLYEHDIYDEFDDGLDDVLVYSQDKKITVYTGRVFHAVSVCYNKLTKVYSITTVNHEYVDFRKSAVLCIEDI